MAASILASSMVFIDSTALNVVLPSLQHTLEAKGTDLFWILNAYLLMLASFVLLGGSLGDKLGRKRIFIIGIIIFISGSALCGFAPTVHFLIAFRMLQGMGGALMIPGSLSLISASFSAKERGKAIGTWSAFTTIVTIGGPIVGGALGDAGLWRFIFFINIPIGLISIFILWFKVEESRDEDSGHSLDYPGAIAAVVGLAMLTFGFLRIPDVGFRDWQVYTSLAGGAVVIAIFIFIENKSRHPMMPLELFSNKTFTGTNLLTFFLYAGLGAGILFLTLNLVQIQGYSQLQGGLTLLPFTILMILLARFAGGLADKYGPRWLLILGPAVAGAGLLLLSFVKQTSGSSEYWTTFFPGIVCFGLGMSFTVAPLTATVMGALPNHFAGTASGVNNAMTRISSVFANAIFGFLAIIFFSAFLTKEIAQLPLDRSSRLSVLAQASDLGNAAVPANVKAGNRQIIERAYKDAFIASYSKIMKLCSLLAFTGALMSFIFIRKATAAVSDS